MSPRSKPQPGSRARRREEQRKKRRRVSTMVMSGLLALAVVVALVVVVTRGGDDGGPPAAPQRTQRTVLFQVQGTNGTTIVSALLVHDSDTDQGAAVLIPSQLLAQVPGVGSMPFGRALQTASLTGSSNAIADLLGIVVDGGWSLDQATFGKLVDGVGGVSVDVDREVLRGRTVVLAAGQQRLGGAQAYAYATFLARDEQEQARQARVQSVLDALVLSLPADVGKTLAGLGEGSKLTLPAPRLAEVLKGMKADDAKGNLQYRVLPVILVNSTTDQVLFRVDAPAVRGLVDEVLAASVPEGVRASGNRVLVLNGVGTPGLGAVVREKLVPAGFVFVGSRNAPSFEYVKTEVLIPEATADAVALGARVARALGVPESSVMTSRSIGTIADVIVIVGKDFKP
jgi:hypothetical protein